MSNRQHSHQQQRHSSRRQLAPIPSLLRANPPGQRNQADFQSSTTTASTPLSSSTLAVQAGHEPPSQGAQHRTPLSAQQPSLHRKSPFYVSQMPPMTPPQAPPTAAAQAVGSHSVSHQTRRFADRTEGATRIFDDNKSEDTSETGRSFDDSTPTASSVYAASLRRREEAKSMKHVPLTVPRQQVRRQSEGVIFPAGRQPQLSSLSQPGLQRSSAAQSEEKGKGVEKKRPETAQSFTLPGGQEVPKIRRDFENMKRISRPSSSSAHGGALAVLSAESVPIASPLSVSTPLPKAPVVKSAAQFEQQRPPSSEAAKRTMQDFEAHRITPVQEESDEQSQPTPRIVQQPRRQSHASLLLRRSSFDSTSTALDTPQLDADDDTPAFFDMVGGAAATTDAAAMYAMTSSAQPRRGGVTSTADRLSDVTEQVEPRFGINPSSRHGTPRSQNMSAHMEQLHRFIYSTAGSGSAARSAAAASQTAKGKNQTTSQQMVNPTQVVADTTPYSTADRRPLTGNSTRQRPGTGQTRVSFEAAPPTRSRRRLGSADSHHENRLRIFGSNKELLRFFQQRDAPVVDKTKDTSKHTHDKAACRQCFRAGFDCAVQLHTGQGTGARKALQEFVMAGGLDALSGVEDFYEGSVWASHVATGAQSQYGAEQMAGVTGRNFVDRLGEVAFGESALSRPVTRGAVQNMLEERGRALAERGHSKTVEDFLEELQRLQTEQEMQDALQTDQGQAPTQDSHGTVAQSIHRSSQRASAAAHDDADEKSAEEQVDDDDDHHLDDLPFLADRWPLARKMLQLTICALWIFCVQCIDAGYEASLSAIAADTKADMLLFLQVGQFAFLAGQGGGLLIGPALASFGRHRSAPILVILFTAVCVVSGFVRLGPVLVALHGVLGCLAGAFESLTLAMLLDMSTTQAQRLSFLTYVAAIVVAAHGAAPWIARLVLSIGSWSWLYWTAAIVGVCYVVLYACVVRETDASAIYRAQVRRLQAQSDSVWTQQPRPTPTLNAFFVQYVACPYVVLSRHLVVTVSSVVVAVTLGALAAVNGPYAATLMVQHQMQPWKESMVICVCVGIGMCVGACATLLPAARSGRHGGELGGDKAAERSRVLYMDESGMIDARRPAFYAEAIVLRVVVAGFIAFVVGLFVLALTATLTSWIFSAVSLCVVVAGAMMIVVGVLHYLAQAYFPAHRAVLREVSAVCEQHGDEEQDNEEQDDQETLQDDHSLMSGADETGVRLHSSWALSAVCVTLALALIVGGGMTVVGPIASARIGFTVFAAIVASSVLGLAGLALCVLVCMGARMRHQAFTHVARTEQRRRRMAKADIATVASTGSLVAQSAPIRVEDSTAKVAARRRFRWWPWLRASVTDAAAPARLSISAPFDVQHVASGGGEELIAFAGVAQAGDADARRRRSTLVGDVADKWHTLAEKSGEPTTPHVAVPLSPRAMYERRSSLVPDRTTTPVQNLSPPSPQQQHSRRRPILAPPSLAASPRPHVPHGEDAPPSIRVVYPAAKSDKDAVDSQRAAQQAQMAWSFSRAHARQPSMGGNGVRIVAAAGRSDDAV